MKPRSTKLSYLLIGILYVGCLVVPQQTGLDASVDESIGRSPSAIRLSDVPYTGPVVVNSSAALHEHLMAEFAFSGKWHWESVDGDPAITMRDCDGNLRCCSIFGCSTPGLPNPLCPSGRMESPTHAGANGLCGALAWIAGQGDAMGRDTCCHGGGVEDCNYKATNGGGGGDPYWAWLDWPKWDTKAHPQYHWGNLLQARARGLKLMVVQTVENYVLCTKIDQHIGNRHPRRGAGYPCDHGDSYNSIKRQIANLETFVGNHSDFLEIALSPADARRIIASGKMAIVIGVEADYAWGNERYPIDLSERLREYYELGVRTAYLAHKINTRLAGAALYEKTLWGIQSTANCFFLNIQCGLSTVPYAMGNGPESPARNYYELTDAAMMDRVVLEVDGWNGFRDYPGGGMTTVTEYNYAGFPVSVPKNSLGLTSEGRMIVHAMMDKGMLIEISHLSEAAVEDVYAISQDRMNYPLFASHGQARRILPHEPLSVDSSHTKYQAADAEMALSDGTLAKIAATDGMLGHFASPEPAANYPASGVTNNCVRSTRSLAQSLAYAFDAAPGIKLAWGFDLMGFGSGVAPRNGYSNHENDWCGDGTACAAFHCSSVFCCPDAICWDRPRCYDIYGTGNRAAQGIQQSGRMSDHPAANQEPAYFNTRGFGHIGMIGMLHTDLQAVGLRSDVLAALRDNSAENFIRMWEKADYIRQMSENARLVIPIIDD